MRILIAFMLFFGAHFSLAANLPTQADNAWIIRPFTAKACLGCG